MAVRQLLHFLCHISVYGDVLCQRGIYSSWRLKTVLFRVYFYTVSCLQHRRGTQGNFWEKRKAPKVPTVPEFSLFFGKMLRLVSALSERRPLPLSTFCVIFPLMGGSFSERHLVQFEARNCTFPLLPLHCVSCLQHLRDTHGGFLGKAKSAESSGIFGFFLGNPQARFGTFLTPISPLFLPYFRLGGPYLRKAFSSVCILKLYLHAPTFTARVSFLQHRRDTHTGEFPENAKSAESAEISESA